MTKLSIILGAFLGHFAKGFTITTGVLFGLWLWLDPETVGKCQAKAEYAFILEAERLGLWSE